MWRVVLYLDKYNTNFVEEMKELLSPKYAWVRKTF